MNLTLSQTIAMAISTLSVLAGASAQLTTMFGENIATTVTTICSLFAAILGGWIATLSGQGAVVKQVAEMPGVDNISVNAHANQTLAMLAIDPTLPKISHNPDLKNELQSIASGGEHA